jgi:hypothetical protein
MSKKLKYKPLRQNETLNVSVALSQASALLDQAALKAMRNDDSELLLEVADRWIAIGSLFSDSGEKEDEHVDTDSESRQYGFSYERPEPGEPDE